MTREEEIKDAARKETYLYNEYYNFQQGAKWADEHPHWVKLQDERPEYGVEVIIFNEGWNRVDVGTVHFCGPYYVFRNAEGETIGDMNSYWTASPKLPKKGGEK